MTPPTPYERLRAALLTELNERQWDGIAYAAHGRHKPHRNAGCRVCQGDVDAIADLVASTALRVVERQVRGRVAAEIGSVVVLARKDQRPGEAKAEAYQHAARIARGEGPVTGRMSV